jgi:2-hydroxychromene-2-carboxylate isomerase
MSTMIEMYWDLGSTNSHFALHLIKPIAERHGAKIVPHPFNLGHVFRKHGYVLMDEPEAKIIASSICIVGRSAITCPSGCQRNFPSRQARP